MNENYREKNSSGTITDVKKIIDALTRRQIGEKWDGYFSGVDDDDDFN